MKWRKETNIIEQMEAQWGDGERKENRESEREGEILKMGKGKNIMKWEQKGEGRLKYGTWKKKVT